MGLLLTANQQQGARKAKDSFCARPQKSQKNSLGQLSLEL